MVYMDEWEYHIWLKLHGTENKALLQAGQTTSEEVMTEKNGSSQPLDPCLQDEEVGS
jgi:hypothetical protein